MGPLTIHIEVLLPHSGCTRREE